MAAPASKVAFGFSTHTGWAQAVVASGPLTAPRLLHRGRIDLGVGKDSVHVFHAAAEMTLTAARSHVDRCAKRATANAESEIATLVHAHGRAAIGVVVGNAKLPPFEAILKSHMLIHAAEGDFYRRAILAAAATHKLKAAAVPAKELADAAAAALRLPTATLAPWLTSYGKSVGRPWGRDEKDAFLAACIALAP